MRTPSKKSWKFRRHDARRASVCRCLSSSGGLMCPAPNSSRSPRLSISAPLVPASPRRIFFDLIRPSICLAPPHRPPPPALFPAKLLRSQPGFCGRSPPGKCASLACSSCVHLSKSRQFLAPPRFHPGNFVTYLSHLPTPDTLFRTLNPAFLIPYPHIFGGKIPKWSLLGSSTNGLLVAP